MQAQFKTKDQTHSKFFSSLEPLYKPMTFQKFLVLGCVVATAVVSARNWQILLMNTAVFAAIPAPVVAAIAFFLFFAVQYFEIQPELQFAAQDDPKTLLRRMVAKNADQLKLDAREEFRQHPLKVITSKFFQILSFGIDLVTNWVSSTIVYGAAPIAGFSAFIATGSIAALTISWAGLLITVLATFGIPILLGANIKDNKYD